MDGQVQDASRNDDGGLAVSPEARRLEFLAEAGRVLVSSLDYETTLDAVAHLAVPGLADYCTVFLAGDGGPVRRVSLAHRDPEIEAELLRLFRIYVTGPQNPRSMVARVLATGEAVIHRRVPAGLVRGMFAKAPEILELIRALRPVSAMSIPLIIDGDIRGAINFAVAEPRQPYGDEDIALARELANMAALAIERARLFEREQRAVRTRDDVLSVVSHDLKTPLNAIRLGTSILEVVAERSLPEGVPDNQTAARQLEIIGRAVRRMTRLIDDLLDAARLEAGTFAVDMTPVDLTRVVSRSLDLHEAEAESRGISLSWVGERALPLILGDASRIEQALSNLLGNAIKFSDPGASVRLESRVQCEVVEFVVSDTGIGIAPERLSRLFDRFWHESVSRDGAEGSGLGLWIARGIIEAHGGTIGAESGEGDGSRFYVTLPRLSRGEPPNH